MHLLIDQRIEALTHIRIEFIMDCSDQIGFHPQHRLGRHPLDYADAGDNDAPRAQLVEQSIEQNTPVHDGHGFDFQPGHHDTARWPAQIGEAEARLDGGKLIVAGRRSPREELADLFINSMIAGNSSPACRCRPGKRRQQSCRA